MAKQQPYQIINGCCWATNDYFAKLYGVHKNTISKWINHLKQKKYIEVTLIKNETTNQIEKRIIKETNTRYPQKGEEYQRKDEEGISEKLKENNTRNNNNICPSNEEQVLNSPLMEDNNEVQLIHDFNLIWELYPRKEGKNKAFKHYKAWLKGKKYAGKIIKLTNKDMWYAVKNYSDLVEKEKTEKRYIKMGSTFFDESILEFVKNN